MSSRSSSSDLSYGTETRYRTDTASDPLSEPLQTPLTPPPDPLDIHDDPPDPNRYSVVSISSLEPRRRHRSRHSGSLYNELSRMMSITEREAKEMRKGLSAALDKLEQSRARATHAERMALDMTQRVREANEHRLAATRQGQVTREELGMYKLQLSNAHAEIQRAQEMLRDQERMRHEAEASAARARDTARKLNQDRLIDLAREEGRKNGYREGLSVGQRIGRYDGGLDMDYEGTPRGRDTLTGMLPDTNYLDDLYANDFGENNARPDAAPPSRFVEELESMNGTAPPATPPLRRRLIHEFQRSDQPPTPAPQMPIGQPITDTYSFPPHTPIHVRQPSSEASVASSSSLPAAPMHPGNRIVSSGPTMPTIPEVVNTEPSSSRPSSRRRSNAAGASQDTFFGGDLGRDGFPAMEQMQDGAGAPVYPMPPFDPYRSPHRGHISVNRPPPDEDLDTAGPYVFAVPPPGSVDGFASPRAGASIRREFSPPPPPVMNDYGSQGPADQRTFTPPRPESFADQPTGRTFDPPPPGTVNDGFGNRSARGRSITREFSPPPPGSFAMPSGGHVPAGYGAPPDPYSSRFSGEMSNQHPRTNGAGRSHEENQRMADILVRHPDSSERPLSQQVATPPRSGPPRRRPQVKMPDRLGPVNPQEMYRRPESSAHARSQSAYGSEGGRREYATQRADSLHRRSSSAAAPEVYIQTPSDLSLSTPAAQHETTGFLTPNGMPSSLPPPSPSRNPRSPSNNFPAGPARTSSRSSGLYAVPQRQPSPSNNFPAGPARTSSRNSGFYAVPQQQPPRQYHSPTSTTPQQGYSDLPMHSRTSGTQGQDTARFPPVLYNDPQLQHRPPSAAGAGRMSAHGSPRRGGTPLPVSQPRDRPSSRVGAPALQTAPSLSSNRHHASRGPRSPISPASPNTPSTALPVPPPAPASMHPSPVPSTRHIPPRSPSPGALPLRAASPALPVRSPSARLSMDAGARLRNVSSDVSLPGRPGSPYAHYRPGVDLDITDLVTASAERLGM